MQGEPNIFEYDNYHDWLRRWFEARHEADPSYTAATFLERVADGPRTLIANVTSDRKRAGSSAHERGISLDRARKWLPELGLSPDGATYWLLLVEREKVIADVRARDRAWRATPTDGARRQLEAQWARLVAIEEHRFGLRRFNEPKDVRTVYDSSRAEDLDTARFARDACAGAVERAVDLDFRARTRLHGLSQAIHPEEVPKFLAAVRDCVVRVAGRYSEELADPPEPWSELAEPRPEVRQITSNLQTYFLHYELFPVSRPVQPGSLPQLGGDSRASADWDVFSYADYRQALTDWLASPLAKGRSQRQLALAAEIDPAVLSRVIRMEAHLTASRATDLATAMGLDPTECRYFALLAARGDDAAPDPEVAALRAQADVQRLRRATLKLLKDWQMVVLVELTHCGISMRDYARIAECLDPPISVAEAERSVAALVETHALQPDVDGELRTLGPSIAFELWPGNSEEALYHCHRAMSGHAGRKFGQPEYYALGARLRVTNEDLIALMEEVRRISRTLNTVWPTFTHAPDRVVYLNQVLFPVDP